MASSDHPDREPARGDEPSFGRGPKAGGRLAAIIAGIILAIFVVLLIIWLVGRSADDVEGAAATAVAALTLLPVPSLRRSVPR
jgi:fumarate reductase subunit D